MILQVAGPWMDYAYAEDGDIPVVGGDFWLGEFNIEEGKAEAPWELILYPDSKAWIYEHDFEFTLEKEVKEELIADDLTVLGKYSISLDGKMIVEIDDYDLNENTGDNYEPEDNSGFVDKPVTGDDLQSDSNDDFKLDEDGPVEDNGNSTDEENSKHPDFGEEDVILDELTIGIPLGQLASISGMENLFSDDGEDEEPKVFNGTITVLGAIVEEDFPSSNRAQQSSQNQENLITKFELTITDKDGNSIELEEGKELDIADLNAVKLVYTLEKPDSVVLESGDTYTIDLPEIFKDAGAQPVPIEVDGVTVATYEIKNNQVVITFTDEVESFDAVKMFVNISGEFNTEIFETKQEVEVEVPYQEGGKYSLTIKAKQEEHVGEDKKTAGFQYVLDGEDKKEVDRNPEYIDWTVRVNDNMASFEKATIIDDLGNNLEIVEGSFIVERIIRNYKNEEIDRETVTNFSVDYTDTRFELKLGDIEDAYDITYTTKIIRPDSGGTHTINNNARIILDGEETKVSDKFTGTWSGDLPVINKEGKLSDNPHVIDWEVKYNFGKENLGSVTLTDTLSHGEVDLDSVEVYEVEVDIDGNIIGERLPVEIIPVKTDKVMTLPDINANGKAYYITFSSTVPVGLNDTVTNTIEDDLENPNSDSDTVDVNTIPIGGKVGEQKVDNEGKPYIEWTITMNGNKVDVPSITVRDVFNKKFLEFDVENISLFKLYEYGEDEEVTNFTIDEYKHTDGREGFKLNISNAGPHEYKFVYRTYYTVEGMQKPELANHAELVFLDGDGQGIGEPVPLPDAVVEGPKAGISKTGKYLLNSFGDQEIEWIVTINKSKILLNFGSTITEDFISGNYEYIADSLSLKGGNETLNLGTDYSLSVDADKKGFVITLLKATKETLTLTFKTTVDDKDNLPHENKATLKWQGGSESATDTVGKRDPGSKKTGTVVINNDGSKTVKWTVDFNTNKNVLHNFKLVDTYTPNTVTVSDIIITSGGADVTSDFTISPNTPTTTGGTFTVSKDKLDAKAYQLTYSTTLSPTEEKLEIKNTAAITYTGGAENPSKTIASPTLGVKKEAVDKVVKTDNGDFINWKITANTDTTNHLVNLVNPVLTDTIPTDQILVQDSIKVERVSDDKDITTEVTINAEDNNFTIHLPDGAYQYIVTFQTEILEYPSVSNETYKYTNETSLSNTGYTKVSDNAWINYFADGSNNNNTKTGNVNDDTENIDWEATVNPLGLTINNAKIIDTLSSNQTYLIDKDNKIVVKAGGVELTEGAGGDYTLVMGTDNRSFTITFNNAKGTINKTITVSYSTRLDPQLIGNITVTNNIKLTGGQSNKELSTIITKKDTSQWFYGGGGSGRLLDFSIKKVTPNDKALTGVKFKLQRVNLNNTIHTVYEEITTTASGYSFKNLRAGRYILTETLTPEGYKPLENPIYFTAGYSETPGEYIITIMNDKWIKKENANASAEGNVLTIVNNYKPVLQGFQANKKLTGLDLTADQFEFELVNGSNNVVARAKNNKEGEIIFTEQSFNQPGTYNFKIREVNGGLGGILYDTKQPNVQVVIKEGANGLEVSEVNYLDNAEFVNTYTPNSVNAVIEAAKILGGQRLTEGQFEFELLDSDGNVLQTVSNKSDGTIRFKAITYDKVGEYSYTIREVQGNLDGITYDKNEFKVTVGVTDDGKGQLHSAITKYVDGPVQFTNTYKAGPDSIVLVAKKVLNGKVLLNDQFEFELVDENNEVIQTVKNNAAGQVIFKEIDFTEKGIYKYIIREKLGNLGGITYDDAEYPVTVTVEDGGKGFLVATANYEEGSAEFTNKYEAASGNIVLVAEKILEGQELRKDQFTFTLTDESGEVIETVTNNAEGQIIFEEIEYEKVGKYTYIIKEVKGEQGGVTYDTTSHTVIVDVIDNGEGKLVANANYIGGPAVFRNIYTPKPDSIVLSASKILRGQNLRNGQFTFKLLNADGEVLQSKQNNGNGQIIFDQITYETAGEFNYTIVEQKGSQRGMTYDETEHEVIVTVTDDGEGTLTAEVEYIGGSAVFKNRYSPPVDPEEPYNPEVPSDPEGRLKIVKRDNKTNELLSGAEFDIVDSRGRRVDTLVTNNRGEAFSKWLPVGNYIIEEVKAPEGYKLDSTLGVERVRNGETLEIVIYNEKEDPTEPEKPVDPEKPIDPTEPETPTTPDDEFEDVDGGNPSDRPEGEDEFEDGGGKIPGDKPEGEDDKPKLPKTGTASPIFLYGLGGLSIFVGAMLRKKKED